MFISHSPAESHLRKNLSDRVDGDQSETLTDVRTRDQFAQALELLTHHWWRREMIWMATRALDMRQTEANLRSLVRFIENCEREHDMITSGLKWLMIAALAVGLAAVAQAEDFDVGKSEFQSSCASCHGTDGKGNGPVSEQLKVPPPDLTMLAKKNNGVFPTNAVYETIYGLKTIPAHGTREMPIWGYRFYPMTNLPHDVDLSYWKMFGPDQSSDVVVRTRILAVVDYLSRIQQK
jgi:mono/diheme cytochrome c family protein